MTAADAEAAAIRRAVETWPPLTDAQRTRLRLLLARPAAAVAPDPATEPVVQP